MLITQVLEHAHAVRQNNASGKGLNMNMAHQTYCMGQECTASLSVKLNSQKETYRTKTKVGKAVYMYEAIRFDTARECKTAADSFHLLKLT